MASPAASGIADVKVILGAMTIGKDGELYDINEYIFPSELTAVCRSGNDPRAYSGRGKTYDRYFPEVWA